MEQEIKVLDLPLKRQWYEMIDAGIKKEEYRIIKPYWCSRLAECKEHLCWMRVEHLNCVGIKTIEKLNKKGYTHVRFRLGYTKTTMLFKIKEMVIGFGNPDWGAPKNKFVFIIRLDERVIL